MSLGGAEKTCNISRITYICCIFMYWQTPTIQDNSALIILELFWCTVWLFSKLVALLYMKESVYSTFLFFLQFYGHQHYKTTLSWYSWAFLKNYQFFKGIHDLSIPLIFVIWLDAVIWFYWDLIDYCVNLKHIDDIPTTMRQ